MVWWVCGAGTACHAVGRSRGPPPVNGPDPTTSPWGEPAPAGGTPQRSGPTRAAASPSPGRAAAASTLVGRSSSRPRPSSRKRAVQMVERTIQVRIIPRTGIFGRARAAVALAVIAVIIGVVVGGAFSVVVWGISSAIHHAAGN